MSLTFTATIIAILALLMGTVSISAWKRTLTVLPLVVLIPGLSVLVAVLSLAVRVDSPLLPFVVFGMMAVGIALTGLAFGWVAADIVAYRRRRNRSQDGVETE